MQEKIHFLTFTSVLAAGPLNSDKALTLSYRHITIKRLLFMDQGYETTIMLSQQSHHNGVNNFEL